MSEDRLTMLEARVAVLERVLAGFRAAVAPYPGDPFVPIDPNDPLKGHPLIEPKLPPEIAAAWEARRLKELGIDHLQPVGAEKLQQMLIEDGLDPNGTEFSQGIIDMREE